MSKSRLSSNPDLSKPLLDNTIIPEQIKKHCSDGYAQLESMGALGIRGKFQIALGLDISSSMQRPNEFFYKETVNPENNEKEVEIEAQEIIDHALSAAFLLNKDKHVSVFPFGDRAYGPIQVGANNFQDITRLVYYPEQANHLKPNTDYLSVIRAIDDYYFSGKTADEVATMDPVMVLLQTDGELNPVLHDDNTFIEHTSNDFGPYRFRDFSKVFTMISKTQTEAERNVMKFFAELASKPIYFVLIGMEGLAYKGVKKENQFRVLKEVAEAAKKQNHQVDLLLVDDPNEITMAPLIRRLPEWLMTAFSKGIISEKPEIDRAAFNKFSRSQSICSRLLPCLFPSFSYNLKHNHDADHHAKHHESKAEAVTRGKSMTINQA